jgi:hypothetical protein
MRRKVFSRLAALTLASVILVESKSTYADDTQQITRTHKNGKLTISFSQQMTPAISFESPFAETLKSFTLSSPNRLVVDIPSTKLQGWHEVIDGPNTSPFSKIRISSHADKLRIVFDLNGYAKPKVEKHESSGVLALSFNGKDNLPTKILAKNTPADKINDDIRASVSMRALIPNTSPKEKVIPNTDIPATNLATLESLEFVKLNPSGIKAIKLKFTELPNFSLTREDETNFVLKLPNTNLISTELGHPYYPPSEFDGLELIQAQEKNNETLIRIGVLKGTEVITASKNSELWLRTTSNNN